MKREDRVSMKFLVSIQFSVLIFPELPIIKNRIKNFLSEIEYNDEFSHTMLHNFVKLIL